MIKFTKSTHNVHYLDAPYDLLVKAFGNDGTVTPRDDYKCMCQWDIDDRNGHVEIYDYKVGTCYDPDDGLERHEITEWHVQGDDKAIKAMLTLLRKTEKSLLTL